MERATEEEQVVLISTQFCSQLNLQTILVSLEAHRKKHTVRVIIDTGSQWSYILKKTALGMGCQLSSLRG
jgi:predicted aconitase